MHERFERRIEEGLKKIEAACSSRKCDAVTIAKRVGRLLGQNSRAAGLFHTDVKTNADGSAKLVWHKVEKWRNWSALSEGCYMLRTNINDNDWSGEELWKAYIQLTEAEAAFRIHKSDLKIRPVWHQKTERVQSHIPAAKVRPEFAEKSAAYRKVFEKNVVKTFCIFASITKILPLNCGSWVSFLEVISSKIKSGFASRAAFRPSSPSQAVITL